MKREYNFTNNISETTNCDIYISDENNSNNQPLVILVHGFRAFKDWGFFPYMASEIAKAGFIVCSIDFSLNTLSDREKCIFDMDRFRTNTVTQEISEINQFIDLTMQGCVLNKDEENKWNKEIYLIGHSLGGGLAITAASKTPYVKKLVTINSIFDFDIYTDKQKEKWFSLGYKEFLDSNTNQMIKLDLKFLEDRLTYNNERSILSMVSKLNIPYLILHSENDVTVSPRAANNLYEASNKDYSKKVILSKANHTLGVSHPFTASNDSLDNAIHIIIDFLTE